MGRLILPAAVDAALRAHLEAGYPHEACGLLVGRPRREAVEVVRAEPAENLNAERARDRYDLDPRAWVRVEKGLAGSDLRIVGVYHSHPDHPARPSPTDLERAWPDLVYLIVAVEKGRAAAATAWVLRESPRGFDEVEIVYDDGGARGGNRRR